MKQLFYILSFLLSFGAFAQNNVLFEKANDLYNAGNYAKAIDNYKAILETGKHSSDLYFNIANAHYKLNHIAPSIYYYEKALQLAPEDPDIKNNIAFAKNMTIDAIDIVPNVGFSKLIEKTTNAFSFDNWAKVAVATVFFLVIFFLIYYFAYTTLIKRLAFIGSITAVVLACMSLSFAFHKFNLDKKDNPAIVFSQESVVKSDPNLKSDTVFSLHEGTKVQVLETYNTWNKIKLTDGKMGWIPSNDIKLLNGF